MTENEKAESPANAEHIIESLGCASLIKAVKNVPSHLWALSPEQLETLIKPTKVAKDLRFAYIGAECSRLNGAGLITLRNLAERARCSYPQGHNLLVGQPKTLVWVFRPFGDAFAEGQVLLHNLIRDLSDFMGSSNVDKNGKIDLKAMDRKIKIFKLLSKSRIGEEIMAMELARSRLWYAGAAPSEEKVEDDLT